MDRAKVEYVLDTLREVDPELTPEEKLEVSRQVAELTGKTVKQVVVEDLFGDRGEGNHRQCEGMVDLRRVVV